MGRLVKGSGGFTILEVVVVFILLAGIMAFVGPKIFGQMKRAQSSEAKIQQHVAGQIELYRTENGRYPDSLGDLIKAPPGLDKWNGPYVKPSDLKDVWGNDYQYATPGTAGRKFDLVALGADGKIGGEGEDRDIPY
jgi:general secretion pathway protein G